MGEPSPAIPTPVKTEPMSAPDVMDESYPEAPLATQDSKHDMVNFEDPSNYDYSGYEDEEQNAAQFDASNSHALRPEGNKEMAKFVLSHLDEGLDQEGKRQFSCRLCEFSSERKEKVRQHVESWHGDQLVTMLALTAHSSDRLKIVIRQFRHVLSPDLLET